MYFLRKFKWGVARLWQPSHSPTTKIRPCVSALFFPDIYSISTRPSCWRRCPRCSRCTGEHGGVGRHATCPDSSVHLLHLEQLVPGGVPFPVSSTNQAHRIILAATSAVPCVETLQSHEVDWTVTWRRSFALSSCEHFLIVNNVASHSVKLVISRHIWEHTLFRSHAIYCKQCGKKKTIWHKLHTLRIWELTPFSQPFWLCFITIVKKTICHKLHKLGIWELTPF